MYYACLVPNPFHQLLTYACDLPLEPGTQVLLPYGKGLRWGWVWNRVLDPKLPEEKIRTIVDYRHPGLLPATWRSWMERISHYYHVPLVQFASLHLPGFLWEEMPILPEQYGQCIEHAGLKPTPLGVLYQERKISIHRLLKAHENPNAPQLEFQHAPFQLSSSQQACVDQMPRQGFSVTLLEGPTGSGKTEVYLQVLCELAQQYPVLLLLPEIALTKHMRARMEERLGTSPWIYHSGLSRKIRQYHWIAAAKQQPGLWLGTRSAAFLPAAFAHIIVDEEHDASHRQTQKGTYSAKHILLMRAQEQKTPVILGSASPCLESLHLVESGKYQKLELEKRFPSKMTCDVIDARAEPIHQGLAMSIWRTLDHYLSKKHHVLLFLNRRGYAPICFCTQCQWKAACQHCDALLVIHKQDQSLRCHLCEHKQSLPESCPQGHAALIPIGMGTQRLEEALNTRYPEIPKIRIDQDNAQALQSLDEHLESPEPRLFLGTQMLSKGFDGPFLRAVIIVDMDAQLLHGEAYADERPYQLLVQVMGRAGRRAREDGELQDRLLIQTYLPHHPLWQHASSGSLKEYPAILMSRRKQHGLPPHAYCCQLRLESTDPKTLQTLSKSLKIRFQNSTLKKTCSMYGPFPSWIQRKQGKHHHTALLLSRHRKNLDDLMNWMALSLQESKASWFLLRDYEDD